MKLNLFFVLLFTTYLSFSQTTKKTFFGFKGGLNFSNVVGQELDGTKTRYVGTELYGSLFADTELNDKWNLEYELLFSYTDDYHFIDIPIHLKYKIKKWNILFGPKLDFLADNDNLETGYQFQNFGVSFEIGTQYSISKKIFAELRYSKSMTKQIDDLFLEIYDGKRNTLRLGLGIRF
ncbi:outer membrane beta-barrel protein [Urechidicola croceus]|uniref:Outer membrane protein beta-barrel domain-containing protein n=1 Tax=Urechidicola croceus TaxID=1850246 RepID=A0A1D8P448_9FLAO|nr:outer membrane beta-barrel protein [Urechidicola croceus]AOW19352.1 hypothetical protein LPB138_01040 [Urechidicola croceus]